MSQPHSKIACIGEAMLEFSPAQNRKFALGIAGDVFNTAAGLSLLGCRSSFISATGTDPHSELLIQHCTDLGVNTRHIVMLDNSKIGLYLISNDASGERFFSYWRDNSAAHQWLSNPSLLEPALAALAEFDYIYLSGISLSRTTQASRDLLWAWLAQARKKGTKIIYDGNYRPALWASRVAALEIHEQTIQFADIFLPGIEDELGLRQLTAKHDILKELESYGVPEMVVKNGTAPLLVYSDGKCSEVAVSPVDNVVDTSGAGDSFNAAYLAGRLQGLSAVESAVFGGKVSAMVIQHRGAIPPLPAWTSLSQSLIFRNRE